MKTKTFLIFLVIAGYALCSEQADIVEHVAVVETPTASTTTTAEVSVIKPAKPLVQIAILLDTSGSMEGLIEQGKEKP